MKRFAALLLAVCLLLTAAGCGGQTSAPAESRSSAAAPAVPQWGSLALTSSMQPQYATEFAVDYYEGGYKLLTVRDTDRYLVVPEGGALPQGLDADIVPLYQPLDSVYLAATAAMALFDVLDSLDAIKLSGTQANGWYIENAAKAMEAGDILFAGKYSQPDYELLTQTGCDLAIESTMIYHTPKVKEMLEQLGIPVFVEGSSYEQHPLGRTEWVRLYGAMLNKEEEADAFFTTQSAVIEQLKDYPNTEKTVGFFYVSSDGRAVVRTSDDYLARMIEIAGGRYVFDDLTKEDSNNATMTVTMESFYREAADADFLIYNSTIDELIETTDDLIAKSDLLADFKAVREGNVWCTGKYLYQATDIVGSLIVDLHNMLTGDTESMTFLYPIR